MSNHTVPDSDAASCTGVATRQTLCAAGVVHGGSVDGSPAKALRSAALGPRAGSSPPPSTSTTLLTGEAAAAGAAMFTTAVISFGWAAPALTTALLLQLNWLSLAAPVQVQPAPVGAAARVRPVGRRSLTE